jgi:hypothetical protein
MSEKQKPAKNEAREPRAGSSSKRPARRVPKALLPARGRQGPLTVFIHIPKTAGTTVIAVMRDNFPLDTVKVLGNVFHSVGKVNRGGRSPIVLLRESGRVLTRDIHLLGGHIPYGVHHYLPSDSRYVTFLRDPIERTLSHYYRILSSHRKTPLPEFSEEPSFEEMATNGEYLYDNLQTRFLSGEPEPFDEVTEEMFENARANLEKSFVAFGLVERFEESLVLLKRRLGLSSVLYVSKRMTPERPRTAESKAELVPLVERFNSYDVRLYEWATQRFEQMVSEEGPDFLLDLAALRAALSKDHEIPPAPPASALSRDKLWEELMRARVELLGWQFDFANSRVRQSEYEAKVARLLGVIEERIEGLSTGGDSGAPAAEASENGDDSAEGTRGGRKSQRVSRRRERSAGALTQKEARVEELRKQIAVLEAAVGDGSDESVDPHVVRELERLRENAAEAEDELHGAERRGAARDGRQAQVEARQRQRKMAALTRHVESLADAEQRLESLRENLRGLRGKDGAEAQGLPEPRRARVERLQELITQKEREVEDLKERISEDEAEIAQLGEVAEAAPTGPASAQARLESLRRRIRDLEESGGAGQDVADELERLRGVAAQVEDRLRRVRERREAQEARRTRGEAQRHGRKIAALTRQRDSSAQRLESASEQLERLEKNLGTLRAGGGADGPAEGIERLQELIDEKRSDVELLRERISEAERQLGELTAAEGAKPEPSDMPGKAVVAER